MIADFLCPFCIGVIAGGSAVLALWASCHWQLAREMRPAAKTAEGDR